MMLGMAGVAHRQLVQAQSRQRRLLSIRLDTLGCAGQGLVIDSCAGRKANKGALQASSCSGLTQVMEVEMCAQTLLGMTLAVQDRALTCTGVHGVHGASLPVLLTLGTWV